MNMNESDFNRKIDETLLAIEEAIDESGVDIDYENIAGILTLAFDDGSQVILNRQGAASQLWLAAKNGGFHFDWDEGRQQWVRDTDQAALEQVLNEVLTLHSGEDVALELGGS